jgi:hypothetical protein
MVKDRNEDKWGKMKDVMLITMLGRDMQEEPSPPSVQPQSCHRVFNKMLALVTITYPCIHVDFR